MSSPTRLTRITDISETLLQRQAAFVALAENPSTPMEIVDRDVRLRC